ncbi:hypothetical protein RclHR1_04770009 [Rhizophagus clarus]|uniref:Uncharacterized protein n=1 Tax=Rhizophagus clarus TaxID=94130 RepID=A0A2Z6RKN8_9GLOM|nr:hypothetical protein RclHR1_04770009 [Rhizophagus clarus]
MSIGLCQNDSDPTKDTEFVLQPWITKLGNDYVHWFSGEWGLQQNEKLCSQICTWPKCTQQIARSQCSVARCNVCFASKNMSEARPFLLIIFTFSS